MKDRPLQVGDAFWRFGNRTNDSLETITDILITTNEMKEITRVEYVTTNGLGDKSTAQEGDVSMVSKLTMTPLKVARRLGLKSLTLAYELTGENRQYFAYMHKTKPLIFQAVIMGLVKIIEEPGDA